MARLYRVLMGAMRIVGVITGALVVLVLFSGQWQFALVVLLGGLVLIAGFLAGAIGVVRAAKRTQP